MKVAFVAALVLAAGCHAKMVRKTLRASAPGAAPSSAAAPGAAPVPAPAAAKDSWGADTHGQEFGKEYLSHERKNLKEPSVHHDAVWQNEMERNVADFDPHGHDFVTDRRSPAKNPVGGYSGASGARVTVACLAGVAAFLAF